MVNEATAKGAYNFTSCYHESKSSYRENLKVVNAKNFDDLTGVFIYCNLIDYHETSNCRSNCLS